MSQPKPLRKLHSFDTKPLSPCPLHTEEKLWIRVTSSMLGPYESSQNRRASRNVVDKDGGAVVSITVNDDNCIDANCCKQPDLAYDITRIPGAWTKIRYTQAFTSGDVTCWSIFGKVRKITYPSPHLQKFDETKGDTVTNTAHIMDVADGIFWSCQSDNSKNFWFVDNSRGNPDAKATVQLRRLKPYTESAGFGTVVECFSASPKWEYRDVWIYAPPGWPIGFAVGGSMRGKCLIVK